MERADFSYDKLYDLLDRIRVELKADISNSNTSAMTEIRGLRSDFTTLERGRLTRAESDISDMRLAIQALSDSSRSNSTTLTNKFLALQAIATIILSGFSTAFFVWLFTRAIK